jgi:Rod binding domain-containing protein
VTITNSPAGVTALSGLPAPRDSKAKIEEAASQFEALLVAQMLRQIRESGGSEEQSGNHLMGFAEEQLAQVLSAQGGLGIAGMASASLIPASPRHAASGADQPVKPGPD